MSYYSAWPVFAAMALLLVIARLPWFKVADETPSGAAHRTSSLDGLRGFLAYAVFFGHTSVYHRYLLDGSWQGTTPFYGLITTGAVALFFMITGYLFWGKLLDKNGKPDWIALYVGRLFRIGPLYLFAVAAMYLIAMTMTGFRLNEPFSEFVSDAANWFALGISPYTPDVNGYQNTRMVLSGVTWTLLYEWRFYASLLALGLVARLTSLRTAFVVLALAVCLVRSFLVPRADLSPAMSSALFLFGMLTASLERHGLLLRAMQPIKSGAFLAALALYGFLGQSAYSAAPAILLGFSFYLVVSGANPLGIFTSMPAKRIGDMSFSIYLLQGLVMTAAFLLGPFRPIALFSPLGHWLTMTGCAVTLLCVSRMTYAYIERPGIDLGKAVARQLRSMRP